MQHLEALMFELDPTAPNIVPGRYRQVTIGHDAPSLDPAALEQHFLGREAYMRTRYLVVAVDGDVALVEVTTGGSENELFSPIEAVRVLAGPDECVYVTRPELDVGVASQFVPLVEEFPEARCLIVEGRYSHVSFLLNPAPMWITVLDIVPPGPSKLADQTQRLLDVGEDLPPIGLRIEEVNSLELLATSELADSDEVLLPCRTTGVALAGSAVSFLDERPPKRDWVLLGCERSREIHHSFYDETPQRVDTCPRQFLGGGRSAAGPTVTRCCMLQQGQETHERTVIVPWGSSLSEVGDAIESLATSEGLEWTPT